MFFPLSKLLYFLVTPSNALALLVLLGIFSKAQVSDFGWRIAFLIGGVAAVVVFWLRRSMDESLTPEQLEAVRSGADSESGSIRELVLNYWRPLLVCFLVTIGGTIAFYTYSVNAPAIVKTAYEDHGRTGTWINLIGLIFLMVLQPIGGIARGLHRYSLHRTVSGAQPIPVARTVRSCRRRLSVSRTGFKAAGTALAALCCAPATR